MLNEHEQPAAAGEPNSAGDPPNLVVTGFMGTGKSTVGALVADLLGFAHVDTDDVIVERHGPIADIFSEHGEAHFRALERQVASELGALRRTVISTGGGMLLDERNVLAFEGARIVCLAASAAEVVKRLEGERDVRPLLKGPDPAARIAALMTERAATYGQFEQVYTDGLSAEEVARTIAEGHR